MFKAFSNKKELKKETPIPSIQEVVSSGIEEVFPNKEYLTDILKSDKKITLYLGIDPTGPTLHLGHAIELKKLRDFQLLGHKIILLIGDFTGMIGDPTDKSATRQKLTREEVLKNAELYKQQARTFLDFEGTNPAEVKYNSEWLSKMTFSEVLDLASYMTVDQMLKRDMFEKRMKEDKPIYIHEFLYPLLQGYDSVAMEVDGEIGGNDQMFNMLTGRTLLRQIKNKEKFVITMKLLADDSGKKMGKTEGNMVTLADTATDMFGKVMSWTDGMIIPGFELCTFTPKEDIVAIKENIEKGDNPKNSKVLLAKKIVTLYHGNEAAEDAYINFENTFAKGGVSEDATEITVKKETNLADALFEEKIITSKKELERLVNSGAVTNMTTGKKVENMRDSLVEDADYKIGKRLFVKVKIQ